MLSERAMELGRLIGQSAEYQAVKRANDSLSEDKPAMALLEKMETLRRDAQKLIQKGEQPTAEMEQALDDLLGRVQVNQWILDGIRKGATSSIITLG